MTGFDYLYLWGWCPLYQMYRTERTPVKIYSEVGGRGI
jgi:hypothetical protein